MGNLGDSDRLNKETETLVSCVTYIVLDKFYGGVCRN